MVRHRNHPYRSHSFPERTHGVRLTKLNRGNKTGKGRYQIDNLYSARSELTLLKNPAIVGNCGTGVETALNAEAVSIKASICPIVAFTDAEYAGPVETSRSLIGCGVLRFVAFQETDNFAIGPRGNGFAQ